MSIQEEINELEAIRYRLKEINVEAKKYRARAKQLEENIARFLESKNLPGIKDDVNRIAVVIEEKDTRSRKKNKERDSDAINILEKYGVHSPERVLKELLNARKGIEQKVPKIKLQKYND